MDAHKTIKSVLLVTSADLILTMINFITTIIILNQITIQQYGKLSLFFSFLTIFLAFLDFGITGTIIADSSYYLSKNDKSKTKSLIKSYGILQIFLGLFFALLIYVISKSKILPYSTETLNLLTTVSFFVIAAAFKNIFLILLQIYKKFKEYSIVIAFESIIRLIILLLMIKIFGYVDILKIVIVYLITQIILLFILLYFAYDKIKEFKEKEIEYFAVFEVLKKHGKYSMLNYIVITLKNNSIPWIINSILGLYAVGLFSAAQKMYDVTNRFVNAFNVVILPSISEYLAKNNNIKKVLDMLRYVIYASIFVVISIELILLTPATEIIRFFSETFYSAIDIFKIMIFLLPFASLTTVLDTIFYATKNQKMLLKINTFCSILLILLLFLSTKFFGLVGSVLSILIVAFFEVFLKFSEVKK